MPLSISGRQMNKLGMRLAWPGPIGGDDYALLAQVAFASCPRAPRLIDHRKTPSHGYRAVHVVVFEDGIPVEIQIGTKIQDTWAQITEKLGDAWGRGLRYGLGPDSKLGGAT